MSLKYYDNFDQTGNDEGYFSRKTLLTSRQGEDSTGCKGLCPPGEIGLDPKIQDLQKEFKLFVLRGNITSSCTQLLLIENVLCNLKFCSFSVEVLKINRA